ncbi:MAG TPA: iron-sulfur cluster-binding domain-containing protein [Chitinophagales bacterium]|nr:iron-sulfur cluster-binding domain-containing protein [Chitinophagales bacterium]HNL84294.1 iron-sulfur cluster-binding domain-containing protein [Chitinophagales bacterium]
MAAPIFNEIRTQLNNMLFNTKASYYFEPLVEKYFPSKSLVSTKATVVSVNKENENMLTIKLKPNRKWNGFIAGQYVETQLKINAVNYTRIFSISSSEDEYKSSGTITLTIQKQDQGKVTPWLFENLEVGSIIKISDAKGEFILHDKNRPVLMIAGGSGITPFYAMLQKCANENTNAVLLYYAKDKQHIFRNKLDKLTLNKQITVHYMSSTTEGRLSKQQLEKYCPDYYFRQVFICGPNTMISDTTMLLKHNSVDADNIFSEYFKPVLYPVHFKFNKNKSKIIYKNKEIYTAGSKTILEQLEAHGENPKHGCRMGLCKECQCTKNKGIVYNTLTQKFSEATPETIQICVSIPVGDVEII